MEMTQKQIEIEAQNYLNGLDLPEDVDKQLILENFKNGITWMLMYVKEEKQQWIEKACEWIEKLMVASGNYDAYDIQENLKDFKQSMKGEI